MVLCPLKGEKINELIIELLIKAFTFVVYFHEEVNKLVKLALVLIVLSYIPKNVCCVRQLLHHVREKQVTKHQEWNDC